MAELVILTPVLARPHRIAPLCSSIARATPGADLLFLADEGDEETIAAIADAKLRAKPHVYLAVLPHANYAKKINYGVATTTHPLIFLGADDLDFRPGLLEAARSCLDEGIGVVGTNDLCNKRVIRGEHSTHSLVTRQYANRGSIDEPTKLLHEGYPHEYVDDEFVETARHRGAFRHASGSIVEHLHPHCGKGPMDEIYAGQRVRMQMGRRIYRNRKHLWS